MRHITVHVQKTVEREVSIPDYFKTSQFSFFSTPASGPFTHVWNLNEHNVNIELVDERRVNWNDVKEITKEEFYEQFYKALSALSGFNQEAINHNFAGAVNL